MGGVVLEDCTTEGSAAVARGAGSGRPRMVFVSCSWRDFHAAEAVTAALWAHEPLDPWFDLERLRPGMDWERAWEDALAAHLAELPTVYAVYQRVSCPEFRRVR
ncbi:hypothetical protein ABT072_33580 [Streptomyces sp. NPDC002589]|uniref:hypothetical protein n=1 Tax=Streptomyces sp. NPDC002589 TaxID=3154420 RepID=UPI0033188542